MTKVDKKSGANLSASEKIQRIEEIVRWFDESEVDIDASIANYEEGAKLLKELKAELSKAQLKIEKIAVDIEEA